MSFFAPPPRPGWRPPLWDRPSEATLGIAVAGTVLLGRDEGCAFALDGLRAYPNGFVCSVVTMGNPMAPVDGTGPGHFRAGHPMGGGSPRVGFEFSDGSSARADGPMSGGIPPRPRTPPGATAHIVTLSTTNAAAAPETGNVWGVPTDERGVPTQPVLFWRGGGGSSGRFEQQLWCYPLPPPGLMTIHADWPAQGLPEVSVRFDANLIREAAQQAVVLWEPDDSPG